MKFRELLWLLIGTALVGMAASRVEAAVFDFTPNAGFLTANYVGAASGSVQLTVSGQFQISVPTDNTQPPLINNGVVAWASSSTVYYYMFDPVRTNWVGGSAPAASVQDLKVVDGVVAWSVTTGAAQGAFMRAYDPLRKAWREASESGTIMSPGVLCQGGVVAGIKDNLTGDDTVFYFTYDPTRLGWVRGATQLPSSTSDLVVNDGLVAWSYNLLNGQYRVSYRVYDPQGVGGWKNGQQDGGFVTGLGIASSQVRWNAGGIDAFRGYNGAGGWGLVPVPVSYFAVSTNAGNAAFNVVFVDMSLGANSWTWNFGDGGPSSSRRSPIRGYTAYGRFTAEFTADNTVLGGSSVYRQSIVTDTILPSGTVKINGATSGGFTTNRNVILTLTASDNSPAGITMRISNEGTNWTDWANFVATVPWTLPTNVGIRSVSVQFRDIALNTSSPPATASIQLDTSPLPIASLAGASLTEDAGGVGLSLILDRPYSRTVAIQYVGSNGTAVAGSDFSVAGGILTFAPGITTQPLPVTIINDGAVELNETFSIHLTILSNAVLGAVGSITILDNDPAIVSFTQTNYLSVESNGVATVLLRLSAPSGRPVSVVFAATNGTAEANVDYIPIEGFVIFQPGQTNLAIPITLTDDTLDEYPELIDVRLIRATNGTLSGPLLGTVTIVDDDRPLVSFSQSAFAVLEPTNAAAVLRFAIRLSKPFTEEVAVEVAVDGISATPGLDYNQPFSNIRLTYSPSETNKEIALTLFGDSTRELQETVRMQLVDFFKCGPGAFAVADVVITDDDAPPFMSGPVVTTNGQFTATFTGYPGQVFAVECTSNFTSWTELVRLTNTTGTLTYSQAFATNTFGRFYRTRLLP